MKTALSSIQSTLYSALSQYNPLNDVITGIYISEAPQDAVMPYVVLGEPTASPDDTKNSIAEQITRTIHVWEESSQYKTQEIMSSVLQALTESSLTISEGFFIWKFTRELMDVIQDPEGYQHGIVRVRLFISHE